MTPEKIKAIEVASDKVTRARINVEVSAMTNTSGLRYEDRLLVDRNYHLALARLNEARAELARVSDASFNPGE